MADEVVRKSNRDEILKKEKEVTKKPRKKLTEEEKAEKERIKKEKEEAKEKEFEKLLEKYNMTCIRLDHGEYVTFDFLMGFNIKPYERTRKGKYGQMYDPLGSYKTELKKVLKYYMDIPKKPEPFEGRCEIDIITRVKLPKSATKKEILYALKKEKLPLQKPDNDNLEKTLFDLFTKWLYVDDTQITRNTHDKYFDLEESTTLRIKIYKKDVEIKGRLSKEEEEELCQLLEQRKTRTY